MSGIQESILLEAAVKPASSFIHALLGPKIEIVMSWANEKELKGKLGSDNLAEVMREYLIKLSHRVSEITSITFPSLKLDIFKAYEPLSLELIDFTRGTKEEFEFQDIINGKHKSFVIIDNAGMGKSTFSKFVVTRLLFKSEKIPILFDLRNIDKGISLSENLAKELDFPGRIFNRPLFYKLLELGKFYVILDGFDEVDLDYQESLAGQIRDLSIKGGENTLVLTSRPQESLPDLVHGISLKFMPFTVTQAKSLLRKYDGVSNLDIGGRLIKEINSVPNKFIESPLLVSLLYSTFGMNNSIADRICTFYDEIYHALYKGHDLINKNGYGREKKSCLDFEDFRKLLRSLCYYMMLNRKYAFSSWSEAVKFIEKATAISTITPSTSSNFLDDLLVAVPLMQREGQEYKFFHKTILEYFSAEYIVFDKKSSETLKKIFKSKIATSFEKTFDFISDIDSSLFDSAITCYFADIASKINHSKDINYQVFNTLIFIKKCKVGLWEVDKYCRREKEIQHPIFDSLKTNAEYHSLICRRVDVGGAGYFLAVEHEDIYQNFHPLAWNSITDDVARATERNLGGGEDLSGLVDIIGTNNWCALASDNIMKIKDFSSILGLAESLTLPLGSLQGGRAKILSEEKISRILMKVTCELEFEKEMESFL